MKVPSVGPGGTMGGGILDPNNPYLIPFKIAAVTPLVAVGMAAAPLVVDAGLVASLRYGHRLLSPAQTISGLGVKWVQTKQRWSRIKAGLTVAGLLTPGYHKNPFSSGGGGPGESPTSTEGLHKQGQPVPVVVPAASNSAHGGRRSGSKPRKKCPPGHAPMWSRSQRRWICEPLDITATKRKWKRRTRKCPKGHYWDHRRKKCRPMRDLVDWEAREAYRRDWYGYRRKG